MRIAVIGTGYVGLVSGVCMAEVGHDVVCVDVDPDKIAKIRSGKPPIHERDLPGLLQKAYRHETACDHRLGGCGNGQRTFTDSGRDTLQRTGKSI